MGAVVNRMVKVASKPWLPRLARPLSRKTQAKPLPSLNRCLPYRLPSLQDTIGVLAKKTGSVAVAEKMFSRILANQLKDGGENTADSQAVEELARTMGIEKEAAIDASISLIGGFDRNALPSIWMQWVFPMPNGSPKLLHYQQLGSLGRAGCLYSEVINLNAPDCLRYRHSHAYKRAKSKAESKPQLAAGLRPAGKPIHLPRETLPVSYSRHPEPCCISLLNQNPNRKG